MTASQFAACLPWLALIWMQKNANQSKQTPAKMANLIKLKDEKIIPDIVHEYTPKIRNGNVPIVIDNGENRLKVFLPIINLYFLVIFRKFSMSRWLGL